MTVEHGRLLGAHGIASKGGCQRYATTVAHGAHTNREQSVCPHQTGNPHHDTNVGFLQCGISLVSPHISSGMCGWMLTHADVSTLGAFLYRKVRVGGVSYGGNQPESPERGFRTITGSLVELIRARIKDTRSDTCLTRKRESWGERRKGALACTMRW
jgi:hypothetical protein